MILLPRKKVVKDASNITKELSKFVTAKTIVTKQRTRKEKSTTTDDDDYKIKDSTWNDSVDEANTDFDEDVD